MATGDDAAADGMDLVPGSLPADQIDTEINKTRDYIALRNGVRSVAKGGTGSSTAGGARTNLDVYAKSDVYTKTVLDGEFANINAAFASNAAVVAGKADAAALAGKLDTGGGTISGGLVVSGNLHNPGAFAGGSGTIAYIQASDSRITRGVSARKYKKYIHSQDPTALGDIFPDLVEYQMRVDFGGDGTTYIGYIADDMVGTPAERFVAYRDGEVDGIDIVQLLLAQNAQLHARLTALEEGP